MILVIMVTLMIEGLTFRTMCYKKNTWCFFLGKHYPKTVLSKLSDLFSLF